MNNVLKFLMVFLFVICSINTRSQVTSQKIGSNPTTIQSSAVLEAESTNKGFLPPRMTSTQRDAISSPATGLTIYNITTNCLEWFNGASWYNGCGNTAISLTSNGTAVVSSYSCSGTAAGTLSLGIAAAGVTQVITATVTTVGTYTIFCTTNGVTFAANGTFAGTGNQNITLTASGTPTVTGTNTFTLNTTPNCSFNQTVLANATSGGSAVLSNISCGGTAAGTLSAGTTVSGVTQGISVTVGTVGTYNISTTTNGVTFAATGTFATTGAQNITLTASGTPTVIGTNTFTLNTTPFCSFNHTVLVNPTSGGSAVLSAITCSGGSNGSIVLGSAVINVSQILVATVTTVGTYNISTTTVNGVTYAATGTFAGTGFQNITLNATGTPTLAGVNSYPLTLTSPTCSFNRTTTVQASSNGSAVVSGYSCTGTDSGTLKIGTTVTGVSKVITATVSTIGTYSISVVTNGVTFAATGTFAGTGAQNITLTASGTPTVLGANTYTLNTTPNCSFNRTTDPVYLPANIILSTIPNYFIVSVNDQDYLPYSIPSVAATLTTPQAANGVNETLALNIQGTLTTTGVNFTIPYTVITATVSLPAYSQTINIPAAYTQDGISRNVTFSYSAATLPVGSGTITANIKAVTGTLNVKMLDLQNGIGNDYLGCLLGQFIYANTPVNTTTFDLRSIAAIPDRNITNASHRMFYYPVTGPDGKTWLNNNLGADYANVNKSSFSPGQQATSVTDQSAYGSLFQWGRYSDGHELLNWSSATTCSAVNGTTTTLSTTNTPGNSLYIANASSPSDWRSSQNDALWQGESGANNPCPIGYRIPTIGEIQALNIINSGTAYSSTLHLSNSDLRFGTDGTFFYNGISHTIGSLWSSTVSAAYAFDFEYDGLGFNTYSLIRAQGKTVRCIKN